MEEEERAGAALVSGAKMNAREIEKKRHLFPHLEEISYIDLHLNQRLRSKRPLQCPPLEFPTKRKSVEHGIPPLKRSKLGGNELIEDVEFVVNASEARLSDKKLLSRYPRFASRLDIRDVAACQRRNLSWLLCTVEAIFDWAQNDTSPSFSFPAAALSCIRVTLGKTQASRSAWDLLVTLEHFLEPRQKEEIGEMDTIPIFAEMLRETMNSDAAFLYCFVRREASKKMGLKLSDLPSSTPKSLVDSGVDLVHHRILPSTVMINGKFCKALLESIFSRLTPSAPSQNAGFVLHEVVHLEDEQRMRLNELLSKLLINYLDVPEDIVLKLKYGDDGNRTYMLQKLKRTLDDNVEMQRLSQDLHIHQIAYDIQRTKVQALERKSPPAIYRTALLLAKSESLKLQQQRNLTAQALKAVERRVEQTWSGVLPAASRDSPTSTQEPIALRLFSSWVERQCSGLALKRKTAKQLKKLSWKRALGDLQTKAAVVLQRAFRARKQQREATEDAWQELQRLKREKVLQSRTERRLLAQQLAAQQRHKERLQAKSLRQQQAEQELKAREEAIVAKHRVKEAHRRAMRHRRDRMASAMAGWRAEARLRKRLRKRRALQRERVFQTWVSFLYYSRVVKATRCAAATKIQGVMRRRIAEECVAQMKRVKAEMEGKVARWVRRVLRKREAAAFGAWVAFTQRSVGVKKMCRRTLLSRQARVFRAWSEHLSSVKDKRYRAAQRIQAWLRKLRNVWQRRGEVNRVKSATVLQLWWRYILLRKRISWEKQMLQRYARKMRFRVTFRVMQRWKHKTAVAKRMKGLFNSSKSRTLDSIFKRWVEWKAETRESKQIAATRLQAFVRSRQMRRRYLNERKLARASKKIQAMCRGVLARRDVMKLYWDTVAAVRIQQQWRSHAAWNAYLRRYNSSLLEAPNAATWKRAFDRGLALKCRDPDTGDGLLHRAAEKGSKKLVKLCLREGMDINDLNSKGQSCLFSLLNTCFLAQNELLDYLLCKGAEVGTLDTQGRNLLMKAAETGNEDATRYLCEHIDIEAKDKVSGITATHMACLAEKIEVVEILLENGASLLCTDKQGVMPLHDLSSNGQVDMLRKVLPKIDDLNIGDAKGNTALHFAVAANQPAAVRLLLDEGISADVKNSHGRSALWYAARVGDHAMLRLLTQYDADIEGRCKETGDAPLHCACASGSTECVKILLEEGASTSVQNHAGEVAAHVAVEVGSAEMLQLLMDYDCEVNVRNYNNRTPLGEARIGNRSHLLELFLGNYIERTQEEMKRVQQERKAKRLLARFGFFKQPVIEEDGESTNEDAQATSTKQEDTEVEEEEMSMGAWESLLMTAELELELGTLIDSPWELYIAAESSREFWYNRKEHEFSWQPPSIMRDLAWSVDKWEARLNGETGKMEFFNKKTKEVRTNHSAGGGKVLEKRKIPLEKKGEEWVEKPLQVEGTMNTEEYRAYWDKENKEIKHKLNQEKSALLIQTVYRRHYAALQAIASMQRNDMATRIQAQWRRVRDTRKAERLALLSKHAVRMQSLWRTKQTKRWFLKKSKELRQQRREREAAEVLNPVLRGYIARKAYRKLYASRISPKPERREDWHVLRASSKYTRSFGGWDEYRYKWPDLYVYCNRHVEKFSWDKPASWVAHEKQEFEKVLEIQKLGFSMKAYTYATLLQSIYRGKRMRRHFAKLSRGIKIMRSAEKAYLEQPFVEDLAHGNTRMVVNLCNYMLYLHVVEDKVDKARPLYAMAMQFMERRGPDNAFILYSYACFVASQCEDDFEDIMDYVYRAREADPSGRSFELAEAGFFRLRSTQEPTNGLAQFNYALCLQFFGTCATSKKQVGPEYDLAEQCYLRALQHSPYNKNVVENFNFMLRNLKGADYDAFDAFQAHQQKLLALQNLPKLEAHRKAGAATTIQRLFRGWLTRRHSEVYLECTTEEGDIFYYNQRTEESVWKLPLGALSILQETSNEAESESESA